MPVPGYTLGEVLGEGAFAQTRIGHHNDRPDQPVAVKSIRRSHPRFELESIQKEIAVMQRIDHPRCVNLLEVAHSIGRLLACARRVAALLRCPAETVPALASPDAACRQVLEDYGLLMLLDRDTRRGPRTRVLAVITRRSAHCSLLRTHTPGSPLVVVTGPFINFLLHNHSVNIK